MRLAIEELVPTGPALETEGKLDTGCTSTAIKTEGRRPTYNYLVERNASDCLAASALVNIARSQGRNLCTSLNLILRGCSRSSKYLVVDLHSG